VNLRSWLVLAAIAVAMAGGYSVSCWWWPWAACRRCEGAGKLARGDGKVFRSCPRCKATGRRLRAGRWLYHTFSGKEPPSWG